MRNFRISRYRADALWVGLLVTRICFYYRITVTNSSSAPIKGTVRIFMCSINNEAGQPYFIEGTRKNAIEMDRFLVNRK